MPSLLLFHPREFSLSSSRAKESWPENFKTMPPASQAHAFQLTETVVAAVNLALNYLRSYVANDGKAHLLAIEVLAEIMKQPRFLQWKAFRTKQ